MIKTTKKLKNNEIKTPSPRSTTKKTAVEAATSLTPPTRSSIETVPAPAAPVSAPRRPAVALQLINPSAKQVCVAGSFNEWNPAKTPLKNAGNGRWVGELTGISGRHEYLFVVDGQWLPDPNARESVQNPYGGRNSVLVASA